MANTKKLSKRKTLKRKVNETVKSTSNILTKNMGWIIPSLLGLAVIGVLFYGGTHDWFKFNLNSITYSFGGDVSTQNTYQLQNPQASVGECSVAVTPATSNFGDLLTGTIVDGTNTVCQVFGSVEGTNIWRSLGNITTDYQGRASYSGYLYASGDFLVAAVCGACTTNFAKIHINPPPVTSNCSDTDGVNKTRPGFVRFNTLSYYDDCAGNWAVKEYYCNGNILAEQVMACDPGSICYETRGGDYCKPITNAPRYYCCYAMGLKSCYEGGCPPAGIELGNYDTLSSCQANCQNPAPDNGDYTCGLTEWCPSGTCPSGYQCNEIESLVYRWCACIIGGDTGEVHPDWKPGGAHYYPRPL